MNPRPVILLIGNDATTHRLLREVVDPEEGALILVAEDQAEAAALAERAHPDLIMADSSRFGVGLASRFRRDPKLCECLFVVIDGPDDPELRRQGLQLGVDLYIDRPVGVVEVLSLIRMMSRMRRIRSEIDWLTQQTSRTQESLGQVGERVTYLLLRTIDMSIPGAEDRAHWTEKLSKQLADRFEIPSKFLKGLKSAALLHEMGRVVWNGAAPRAAAGPPTAGEWQYVIRSRQLLDEIDELREPAELIGSIFENWDGTGQPNHLERGQIPLRSRILRVLIDFSSALVRTGLSPRETLEEMAEHVGTLYDPLVIAHLQAIVESTKETDPPFSRVHVPIPDLSEGMVLAEDLYTDSGVKLLARGTSLTRANLSAIQGRSRFDATLQTAVVRLTPSASDPEESHRQSG
jgi:response regulator RpfG family c-di-GMP phosphodiesterase